MSPAFSRKEPSCVVDRRVLNEETIVSLDNIDLSIFAPLCGRNRGAFVLDPPDGNTYGCIAFPENLLQLAGVKADANITNSNSIGEHLKDGNITAKDAVNLIDLVLESVYGSTPNVDQDPYACDLGGLALLECDMQKPAIVEDDPIRAVTLAGAFVPAAWATGGTVLSMDEVKSFYTSSDFEEMNALGLNTVQIPVPLGAFAPESDGESVKEVLSDILSLAEDAGLKAILTLVADTDEEKAVDSAAAYATSNSAVLALTLPSITDQVVAVARSAAPKLTLFVPANGGDLRDLHAVDNNVFAALDMPHSVTVGDIASSTSQDDRMKLFYHEAIACVDRAPIEYAACYRHMPVFVANGFDLVIDDCVNEGTAVFNDYGQCGRFNETVDSPWWERHRASFAERQMFSYERGLGWSFAAWKLYGDDEERGVIDSPAKLLSLSDVAAAGLMPSLKESSPAQLACLNPPTADFLLGDETMAPTAGPPPDCGNGWWNFTAEQCDYWIPPTPAPMEPCPTCPAPLTAKAVAFSALSGAAVAVAVCALTLKLRGSKRDGYTSLPN